MDIYLQTLQRAHDILRASHPRAGYAHDVLNGIQKWSGADLKGKARKFSGGYHRQRQHAAKALRDAGGCIIAINRGRCVTAIYLGADDYGNAIYGTPRGVAIQSTRAQARIV